MLINANLLNRLILTIMFSMAMSAGMTVYGQQLEIEGVQLQNSIEVKNSGLVGLTIDTTARAGIELRNIGTDGIIGEQILGNGISISSPGSNGVMIQGAGASGFDANSSNQYGFQSTNSNEAGFAATSEELGFYALQVDTGFYAQESSKIGFLADSALDAGFLSFGSKNDGFQAARSTSNDFHSLFAGNYGFHAYASGLDGFQSSFAENNGFSSTGSDKYGFYSSSNGGFGGAGFYADEESTGFIARKGNYGFRADSTSGTGFRANRCLGDGFRSIDAGINGYYSQSSGLNGFSSISPATNCFYALNAVNAGFYAVGSSQDGFRSRIAQRYGLFIEQSHADGILVTNTTERGIVSVVSGKEAGYFSNVFSAEEPAMYIAHGNDSKYDLFLGSHGRIASNGSVHVYLDDNDNATLDRFYIKNSAGTNVAQFSESGNADVLGNLSKGGGSFKIDHPLDPENKYLYHSFVESPDMMNVYNGNIILDGNGEAVVKLPDYFEELNRDFRYQLTCVGGFAQIYIDEKLSNNQFKIAGGLPGLEVSWQITGIRQDVFANENRIPTEVAKEAHNKGHYLHSKAWAKKLGVSSLPNETTRPEKTNITWQSEMGGEN